jgi:hypothetical protein
MIPVGLIFLDFLGGKMKERFSTPATPTGKGNG